MLLFYIYLVSFVIGGILVGASLFLGGDRGEADGDVHADVDLDGDVDLDTDMDLDGDVDLDGDAHIEAEAQPDIGDSVGEGIEASDFWLPFVSVRFWVFFLCFFGLTGVVLTLLALAGRWSTLIAAMAMGVGSGFAAAFIIQRLKRAEVGGAVTEEDFIGKVGKVLLALGPDTLGKIRIEVRGQVVDLVARMDGSHTVHRGSSVLVIGIEGNEAVVEAVPELEASSNDLEAGRKELEAAKQELETAKKKLEV